MSRFPHFRAALLGAAALAALPGATLAQGRASEWRAPPANQLVDRADARIAQLKADLRLSADQAKNWEPVEKALHEIARARVERLVGKPGDDDKTSSAAPAAKSETDAKPDAAAKAEPAAKPDGSRADEAKPDVERRAAQEGRRDGWREEGRDRWRDGARRDFADRDDDRWRDRDARRGREPADERMMRSERRGDDDAGADALETMQQMAEALRTEADEMQKMADAAGPLYDDLDRGQRRTFLRFLHGDWVMATLESRRGRRR